MLISISILVKEWLDLLFKNKLLPNLSKKYLWKLNDSQLQKLKKPIM